METMKFGFYLVLPFFQKYWGILIPMALFPVFVVYYANKQLRKLENH